MPSLPVGHPIANALLLCFCIVSCSSLKTTGLSTIFGGVLFLLLSTQSCLLRKVESLLLVLARIVLTVNSFLVWGSKQPPRYQLSQHPKSRSILAWEMIQLSPCLPNQIWSGASSCQIYCAPIYKTKKKKQLCINKCINVCINNKKNSYVYAEQALTGGWLGLEIAQASGSPAAEHCGRVQPKNFCCAIDRNKCFKIRNLNSFAEKCKNLLYVVCS